MKKFCFLFTLLIILFSLISCENFVINDNGRHVYIIAVGNNYENIFGSDKISIYRSYLSNSDKFDFVRTNDPVSPLECCPEDAADIANCLSAIYKQKNIPCTSYLLSPSEDKEPTVKNLKAVLDSIKPNKDDLIVFFYSGHGTFENNQSYFCMGTDGNHKLVFLSVSEVLSALSQKGCNVFALIDACECGSGYEQDTLTYPDNLYQTFAQEVKFSNVSVIASSSNTQLSFAGSPNSIYTSKVLKVLGWDTDNNVLNTVPTYMTSSKLFRQTMAGWAYVSQTPELNFTNIDVVIVPRS